MMPASAAATVNSISSSVLIGLRKSRLTSAQLKSTKENHGNTNKLTKEKKEQKERLNTIRSLQS